MFTKLIKIPGKYWFDDLAPDEVALMIEAFLSGDDEYFDPLAFNDFLHAKLKNEVLKGIQSELNKKAFVPTRKGEWPEIDRDYLAAMVAILRAS